MKTGIIHAKYDWCGIIDADGSYPVHRFLEFLTYVPEFDMVVGARTGPNYWGSIQKRLGRFVLTGMVQYVVGRKVPDVNSGMRVFRREAALKHIKRISSGFSFTTTLTLALFLDEHYIKYIPIEYHPRVGISKVKIGIDSLRTMQILVQAVLFYNPLKLFLLVCVFTLVFGLLASLVSLLFNEQAQCWLLLVLTVNITVIIGCLGLMAEALHLNRLS